MLKVGEFVLNTDSRKLYDKDKKEVALAPTLFSLLKFFIDHQNQTCSKDMIIDNVWKGKIVVEANVNQNIKKLRDVLGDSANDPRYIETVTGEGFRFVANSQDYKAAPLESSLASKNIKFFSVLIALAIIVSVFFVYLNKNESVDPKYKELFPITTLKGWEHYPVVSKDEKYLIFNHKSVDGSWDIFVKPFDKESYKSLSNSDKSERFPVISPSQNKLMYFVHDIETCGLYYGRIDLQSATLKEQELIKKCKPNKQRLRGEWINDDEIFYSFNEDLRSPASIYRLNLKTKEQKLVSKPDSKGFGDYVLKYSESQDKLAYIRNIGWSSSEIWIYDLEDTSHKLIKSTPLMLTGLDWHGEWILFYSGAKELSKISSEGVSEEVIARFLTKTKYPFEVNENSIGVVVGDYTVIDVGIYDISSRKSEMLVNSSFNDYFAYKSADNVAFVSTRTGEPQVWLKDKNEEYFQVTDFIESFEVSELTASSNLQLILFNRSGVINIYNYSGEEVFNSQNYSSYVYRSPVLDEVNDRFIYSVQINGEWHIEQRSLSSPQIRTPLFKGTTARPCRQSNCIFYTKDRDTSLYKYIPEENTSLKIADLKEIDTIDQWAIIDDTSLIYLKRGKEINKVTELDLVSSSEKTLLETKAKMFTFDRDKNQILLNIVSPGNTDIMYFSL